MTAWHYFCSIFVVVLMITGDATQSKAALVDRGNGFVYDTELGVTWLDLTFGPVNWLNAVTWASNLVVTDPASGRTFDDWRLPASTDGEVHEMFDGSNPQGFNVTSSEWGHLFYEELGNLAQYDTTGNIRPEGSFGLNNVGPFTNLLELSYWSGTEYAIQPVFAWRFDLSQGGQFASNKEGELYAFAVRAGDIIVPEPSTWVVFGSMMMSGMISSLSRGRFWRR